MPVYEYGCEQCRKRRAIFFKTMSSVDLDPPCPICGGRGMVKLVSRVVTPRSEESRLEALEDAATFGGVDENDPASVARWARRVGGDVGDEMGGDLDEMVEEMAAGEGEGDGDDWEP